MKIVDQSDSEMVLKQSPTGSQIFGVIFAAIGLFAIIVANQNKFFAFMIGSIFVIFGLLVVVNAKSITIRINRASNTIAMLFKTIIGKKEQQLSFNQIKELAIEAYIQTTGGGGPRNQVKHNLVFYTTDGGSILIPFESKATGWVVMGYQIVTGEKERARELGETIAKYINVPFVYREPPTMSELIKQNTNQANAKS